MSSMVVCRKNAQTLWSFQVGSSLDYRLKAFGSKIYA
jgi:hypothetical protein